MCWGAGNLELTNVSKSISCGQMAKGLRAFLTPLETGKLFAKATEGIEAPATVKPLIHFQAPVQGPSGGRSGDGGESAESPRARQGWPSRDQDGRLRAPLNLSPPQTGGCRPCLPTSLLPTSSPSQCWPRWMHTGITWKNCNQVFKAPQLGGMCKQG